MDTIENPPPPSEVPAPDPVPTPDPAASAPPPAATLATNGEVTDERALELQRREAALEERERRARETEQTIADRERRAQEREEVLRHQPAAPAKTKRKRNWSDPINAPDEIED